MVRTLSTAAQAKASAWAEAGQLGGGALGGALVLWLVSRVRPLTTGTILAVLIALPALVALTVAEPAPAPAPSFRDRLFRIASEIRALIRSPRRRWGAVLLISPVGTGAAMGLLPAIASHYSVGAAGVMWVNGAAGEYYSRLAHCAGHSFRAIGIADLHMPAPLLRTLLERSFSLRQTGHLLTLSARLCIC